MTSGVKTGTAHKSCCSLAVESRNLLYTVFIVQLNPYSSVISFTYQIVSGQSVRSRCHPQMGLGVRGLICFQIFRSHIHICQQNTGTLEHSHDCPSFSVYGPLPSTIYFLLVCLLLTLGHLSNFLYIYKLFFGI